LKDKLHCSKYLDIIHNDVLRTFPLFSYNRQVLENILSAYSVYNKTVGYCQGMNYIVAFLLIISQSNEEESFYAFLSLMEEKLPSEKLLKHGFNHAFTNGFPLVALLEKLFDKVLETHNHKLKVHFNQIGLYYDLWFHKWISSLFLYVFPLPFCVHLWDAMLKEGLSFLILIICAMLDKLEYQLIKANTMEKCYGLLTMSNQILINPLEIIDAAKNIKVDWKSLRMIISESLVKESAVNKSSYMISKALRDRRSKFAEKYKTEYLHKSISHKIKKPLPSFSLDGRLSYINGLKRIKANNEALNPRTINSQKKRKARKHISRRIMPKIDTRSLIGSTEWLKRGQRVYLRKGIRLGIQ